MPQSTIENRKLPYPHAHYYIVALLVVTFIAFWDSYFGIFMDASIADHLHGVTATIWIILMAVQSWLIHHGRPAQHRNWGLALFAVLPLMTGAFALVTLVGAMKSIAGHPFYHAVGQALLTVDVLLLVVTPCLVFLALRFRRNVRLHSALMFSTLTGLMPPALSRMFANYLPGLQIAGLEDLYKFEFSLQLSIAVSVALALVLYFRNRKHGWPWLLSAGISISSYVLYASLGQTIWWTATVKQMAAVPPVLSFAVGASLGIAAAVFGWQFGKKTLPPTRAAATATY